MKPKTEFKPEVKFVSDNEKLVNVILGLRAGDISNCLAPDVKHADELLTQIVFLNDLSPGLFDEMLAIFIPLKVRQHNQAVIGEMAQKRADEEGFGAEWREAIEAGRTPHQKDYMAKMVAILMKTCGMNQNQAISAAAKQLGREDEDNIRRTITRSKARKKPK